MPIVAPLPYKAAIERYGARLSAPTYNEAVHAQLAEVSAQKKYHNFEELLETNDIWEVRE